MFHIGRYQALSHAQIQQLSAERSSLVEQKEKVRVQVESMITRLRSMEKA